MRGSFLWLMLLVAMAVAPARSQSSPVAAGADPALLCRAAIATAEREAGLPPRLLTAIARVESGRRDPVSGAFISWPWAINAEGRGSFFPTREAAIAAVRQLQAQGMRSIDVGCMQINLRHHPTAFASLEQAFDPLTNARYGARFLGELKASSGDWMRAAGHYHSHTPELAEAYRARVTAALAAEQQRPEPNLAMAALRPPVLPTRGPSGAPLTPPTTTPLPMSPFPPGAGGGFMLSNRMERAAILPVQGGPRGDSGGGPGGNPGAGRGLDAYRMLPIPVAGRGPSYGLPGLGLPRRL